MMITIKEISFTKWQTFCLVTLLVLFSYQNTVVQAWTSASSSNGAATRTSTTTATQLFMTASKPLNKKQKKKKKQAQPERSILEDGDGHINPDLAHNLWNWEQQHREHANMPKLSLSTRQGLRLVDDIVKKVAESSRGQKYLRANDNASKEDLVQEGVMALMDALNHYREESSSSTQDTTSTTTSSSRSNNTMQDHNKRFEAYARPYMEERLWSILDETARPVQLPQKMSHLWKRVQEIRPQLQDELGGKEPTTEELAARLQMPVETLEMLLRTRRESLSVESTVEIKNPDSLEDQAAHFTDQDEWEEREGHLLDTGDRVIKDELVDDYVDEQYQYEGEDEMWIHQEQIAAPLREIIPDGGPSPDDIALSEMIRHDVGEFLTKTLTPEEVKIVRMCFGLDGYGKPQSISEVAAAMGVQIAEAKESLKTALAKLRTSYRDNYVEAYLEDETDFFGEDSV